VGGTPSDREGLISYLENAIGGDMVDFACFSVGIMPWISTADTLLGGFILKHAPRRMTRRYQKVEMVMLSLCYSFALN
jgi:hypothetical protein